MKKFKLFWFNKGIKGNIVKVFFINNNIISLELLNNIFFFFLEENENILILVEIFIIKLKIFYKKNKYMKLII